MIYFTFTCHIGPSPEWLWSVSALSRGSRDTLQGNPGCIPLCRLRPETGCSAVTRSNPVNQHQVVVKTEFILEITFLYEVIALVFIIHLEALDAGHMTILAVEDDHWVCGRLCAGKASNSPERENSISAAIWRQGKVILYPMLDLTRVKGGAVRSELTCLEPAHLK